MKDVIKHFADCGAGGIVELARVQWADTREFERIIGRPILPGEKLAREGRLFAFGSCAICARIHPSGSAPSSGTTSCSTASTHHNTSATLRGGNVLLPATIRRFAHLIDDVEDDRGTHNGWWVYLKTGWICATSETHCVHEDTLKQCARILATEIERCDCSQCSELASRKMWDLMTTMAQKESK